MLFKVQIQRQVLTNFDYNQVIKTSTNFECYNQCIQDDDCTGAFRIYSLPNEENCFLQSTNNSLNASLLSLDDTEYVVISGLNK